MTIKLNDVKNIAEKLENPLFVVGGLIRNYLISGEINTDIDLCGAYKTEELLPVLIDCGFFVVAEYKRTGTIVFTKNGVKYEYTTFRTESYNVGGNHTPFEVCFTDDVIADAKRRDFTCNAVYYDIKKKQITDPLNKGVADIKNRVLDTVISPDKVFASDGLRLMRLARFCGELSFSPKKSVIVSAEKNRYNVSDISGERIYSELKSILYADKKYSFSGANGHIVALNVLNDIGVINVLFGIDKADFDSVIKIVRSDVSDRLSAFLYGVISLSDDTKKALKNINTRLKPDKKTVGKIKRFLSFDEFLSQKNSKGRIRYFLAVNRDLIKDYLSVKKAQGTTGKNAGARQNADKLLSVLLKMEKEGAPFSFSDLNIGAQEIINCGVIGKDIQVIREKLLFYAVNHPKKNKKDNLQKLLMKLTRKSY